MENRITRRNLLITAASLGVVLVIGLCRQTTSEQARGGKDLRKNAGTPSPAAAQKDLSPLNDDSFKLPFLGSIKGHARSETLHIESDTGNAVDVPLKVFYSPEGTFLHALYEKPGAVDYTNTTETIQSAYVQSEERIVGFPAKNATVGFAEVLKRFAKNMPDNFDFKAAIRVDVSYVLWQRQAENYRPLYIINVYGCEKIADYLPNETRFKRIRYLINDEGKLLVMDNLL